MSQKSRHTALVERVISDFQEGNSCRLWKNSSGTAYQTNTAIQTNSAIKIELLNPRVVKYGIPPVGGGPDIIGIRKVKLYTGKGAPQFSENCVNCDILGEEISTDRFVAIEVKTGTGRLNRKQSDFIAALSALGAEVYLARECQECVQKGCQECNFKGYFLEEREK